MSIGIPYSVRQVATIEDNDRTCLDIKCPHRGIIRNVVISQEDGVVEGFDFNLFNSRAVCPPSSSSSSSAGSTLAEELYSVFGAKTAAGKVFAEYDKEYMFLNADGTPTNPQRHLYLRIQPAGADTDPKEFHIRIDFAIPHL